MLNGAREIEIDDTWLYDRALIFNVEVKDTVHAREGHDEAPTGSERASGESCSCAAADDRHVMSRGECNNTGNFLSAARKGDDVRAAFFHRAIIFVKEYVFRQMQDRGWAQKSLEFAGEALNHKRRSSDGATFTIVRIPLSAQPGCLGSAKPVLV